MTDHETMLEQLHSENFDNELLNTLSRSSYSIHNDPAIVDSDLPKKNIRLSYSAIISQEADNYY